MLPSCVSPISGWSPAITCFFGEPSYTVEVVRAAVSIDVVDRPRWHGASNYGMWDRLWVGLCDLAGVWWLIRRKKSVPEVSEV